MYAVVKFYHINFDSVPNWRLEAEVLYQKITDIKEAEAVRSNYLQNHIRSNPQMIQVIQYDPVE